MPRKKTGPKPRPVSMVKRVAEAVRVRGAASINDILPEFPGVDRRKVHAALCNARDARLLRVKVPGSRHGGASLWEVRTNVPSPLPEVKKPRPIPSVWALGAPLDWEGEWPPLPAGQTIVRIGDLNAPEPETLVEEVAA